MNDIQTYLDYILSKVYGGEVRQAIVDAINQCYIDATAGITPTITTEQIEGGTKITVTVGSVSTSFNVMNGISPQVASASTSEEMTDTDLIYVYTGSETGYVNGDWYFYDGEEWQDGGQYQSTVPAVDSTLTIAGAAADAKKVGDEIADLKGTVQGAIPHDVKLAMDTLFSKMAVKDDESYTNEYAVLHAWATAVNVVSISAVYTQSGTVYDTNSLDSLKTDLVVTAHYSDETTATVTTYTLSGTLTSGTSIITVTHEEKTTTFSVTVTEYLPSGYTPIDYVWTHGNSTSTPIYVQTGVTPTGSTSFEYKVSRDVLPNAASGANSGGHICSSGNGFYAPFLRFSSNAVHLFTARADGTGIDMSATGVVADTPFEIKAFREGTNDVYLNGDKVGSLAMGSITQSTVLRLFNYGSDSYAAAHLFVGKLYYMNIYENDVLIREYVPCKNSSNVVGLYDRVNQTFVGSATDYPLLAPAQ